VIDTQFTAIQNYEKNTKEEFTKLRIVWYFVKTFAC